LWLIHAVFRNKNNIVEIRCWPQARRWFNSEHDSVKGYVI
jgi:hypothetical protein